MSINLPFKKKKKKDCILIDCSIVHCYLRLTSVIDLVDLCCLHVTTSCAHNIGVFDVHYCSHSLMICNLVVHIVSNCILEKMHTKKTTIAMLAI